MDEGREDAMTAEHRMVDRGASGSRLAESRVRVMRMDMRAVEVRGARAAWEDEIERAIDSVKRTNLRRWMRKEWHKAAARDHWSEGRKARWMEWKRDRSPEASRDPCHQSERPRVAQPKVWVKGHVPREFLDWVERHWSHGNETRAVLRGCCFEAWER